MISRVIHHYRRVVHDYDPLLRHYTTWVAGCSCGWRGSGPDSRQHALRYEWQQHKEGHE